MRFRRGLIVGKFSPLHRGHQHLIESAFATCDEVVLVSYAKPEFPGCDAGRRRRWLEELYPTARRLIVDDAWFAERSARGIGDPFVAVPHNGEPEDLHRRFTAWLSQGVLGVTCDAVFTSEDYGDGFAAVLAETFGHPVRHVCLDRPRTTVPISATAIRQDARLRQAFLAPAVGASLPMRILVLGGESTGKTTLCSALGARWGEPVAEEFGRELWIAKNGALTLPDMLAIGREQAAREDRLLSRARRVLVCDTSPLTTAYYSQALFDTVDPKLELLARRTYDMTFLCLPEFPFVQDGTRQNDAFRLAQHEFYTRTFMERGIPFTTLCGLPAARVKLVETTMAPIYVREAARHPDQNI